MNFTDEQKKTDDKDTEPNNKFIIKTLLLDHLKKYLHIMKMLNFY